MNKSRIADPGFADWFEQEARQTPEHGHMSAVLELYAGLRQQMESQGVTQAELARRAGLKPSYISRLFNAPENITMRTAFRLCNALDLELGFEVRPKAESVHAEKPSGRRKPRRLSAPVKTRKPAAVV